MTLIIYSCKYYVVLSIVYNVEKIFMMPISDFAISRDTFHYDVTNFLRYLMLRDAKATCKGSRGVITISVLISSDIGTPVTEPLSFSFFNHLI